MCHVPKAPSGRSRLGIRPDSQVYTTSHTNTPATRGRWGRSVSERLEHGLPKRPSHLPCKMSIAVP